MSMYEICKPAVVNMDSITALLRLELGITEITATLLINRGIITVPEAHVFLHPSLDQLHDPFDLVGMDAAVKRIRQALQRNEKIVIYGDYDVDGVTSSTMLYLYLKSLGANASVYVPSRHEEGYGLNSAAITSFINEGVHLLITVDCGITAIEEVQYGNTSGLDIIITDHHQPGSMLPPAISVINPKIPNQRYPFKELAGVGVTAKLIQAVGGVQAIMEYLDLIAIGTIADIVPLMDENRVYATKGLEHINTCPRPGVSALIQAVGLEGKVMDASKISYHLAPCLNAPGRLSTYHKGYDLIIAETAEEAESAASDLVQQNRLRRELEGKILTEINELLGKSGCIGRDKFIIAVGENWHAGVIGIVASKITERYHRPSIIISMNDGIGTASARSIKGFDLYQALSQCKELYTRFGGHEQAAGLSIPRENIDVFTKRIIAYANKTITDDMLLPRYIYDGVLESEDVTPRLHKEIDLLAPFGMGNPAPRFLLNTASIVSSWPVGKDANHLKLSVALGQRSWDAIGFGMADSASDIHQGCEVRLLTSLQLNEWMGVTRTQFLVHSMTRVLKTPMDINSLLDSFDFKFFNVFLSEFMYNNNDVVSLEPISGLQQLSLSKLGERLKKFLMGTAVLVHTPDMAAIILNELLRQNLLEQIAVRYNKPNPADGLGRSIIILAPDHTAIPVQNYHTLLVPEPELMFEKQRIPWIMDSTGITLETIGIDGRNPTTAMTRSRLELTREHLTAMYKWLRSLVPGRDFWPSHSTLLSACNEGMTAKLSGFQVMLALEIFKELGFLTVESGNQYIRLTCKKNPVSRQLDESALYIFHKAWLCRYMME